MSSKYIKKFMSFPVVALLAVIVSGCFGGGTVGTGTITGFGTKGHRRATAFTLVGTVQDRRGDPVGDALVTITTSFGTVIRRTSPYGLFRAPLEIISGEEIQIDVEYRAPEDSRSVSFSEHQQISPAGASEVQQTIIVDHIHRK